MDRRAIELLLRELAGSPFGQPDKKYEIGWHFGGDASIVVNRRATDARVFVPAGGDLRLLHGLIRAMKSEGSPMSTLTKSYPGFAARGRIEVAISSSADLKQIGNYLARLGDERIAVPLAMCSDNLSPTSARFVFDSAQDELKIHASIVSTWDTMPFFSEWQLMDTELAVATGRADFYAHHRINKSDHLIIELKARNDDRHVVGQLLDYMATVSQECQIQVTSITGLILCPEPSDHLRSCFVSHAGPIVGSEVQGCADTNSKTGHGH